MATEALETTVAALRDGNSVVLPFAADHSPDERTADIARFRALLREDYGVEITVTGVTIEQVKS